MIYMTPPQTSASKCKNKLPFFKQQPEIHSHLVNVLGSVLSLARICLGSTRAVQNGLTISVDLQLGDNNVARVNAL
jgi:hypothetical protein